MPHSIIDLDVLLNDEIKVIIPVLAYPEKNIYLGNQPNFYINY